MRCRSCGHENTEAARFCSNCGTRLELVCASCDTRNEPGSRYCSNCGSGLTDAAPAAPDSDLARYIPEQLLHRIRAAQAGGAMRGERRTVTMLFADIQGSTAAAERLDPEDWAEIINGAFEHLIAPVYRYEGTLARLQGDAILAFFGAPIAHEDDPVRAVQAGLEITAAIEQYRGEVEARKGVPVAVRVGINTGLVVMGEVGSDLRVEYTALGDAINVAARMEQTAAPGSVQITEHTANLAHGMFDLTDIGPVDVKGKAEPVRAFRVEAVRPQTAGRAATTPLVGRETELAAIESAVTRLADGIGAICSVVGEAGIGKSRLMSVVRANLETRAVVRTRAADEPCDIAWLDGRSRSFDTSVPYALFGDLLRRWWGIADDVVRDSWPTIAAAVERAAGEADHDTAAFLAAGVGADVPEQHGVLLRTLATPVLHQRTTAAIAAYLEAEAARQPVLLVLDDLHWGDALSLALVERLMESADVVPLGLLLALRPYRDDAAWRLLETAGRDYGHRYTAVTLDELPASAIERLVVSLVGGEAPPDVTRRILERAGGNPLFVEELVRTLGDEGPAPVPGADVPASLTGLLTARLDLLEEPARLIAQTAAVVGPEFEPAALRALLDDDTSLPETLTDLVRRGILVERRRLPTPVFGFRHVLIQETAYGTTLLRTRRALHARLAEYLEGADPDAIQEIGRHHLAAENRDRAFPYLVRAGRHATRAMALADAIRLFTTALDGVPVDADPELVVQAHDGLGEAYGLIPDLPRASSTYQQLLDYGRSSDHPSVQALALNRLGVATATHAGDFLRAEEYLGQARRIAEDAGDEYGLAEYHMNACLIASMQGHLDRALEHDEETERLGASQGNDAIRLAGMFRRALNLLATMQHGEAEQALEEAIRLAESLGDEESVVGMRSMGGADLAQIHGDPRRALELLRTGVPTLERYGSFFAAPAQARAADITLELGDIEDAIARASHTRRLAAALDQPAADGVAAACLARCYALCGVTDTIDELRQSALDSLATPTGHFFGSTTWSLLGWTNLTLGHAAAAAEDFTIGLEVSSTTRFFERPRLLLGAARAALGQGDVDTARRLLAQARAHAAEHSIEAYHGAVALTEGLVAMHEGALQDAVDGLRRAGEAAAETGRKLLTHDVAAAHVELAVRSDDADQVAQARDAAARVTEQLASTIVDEQLRGAFQQRSEQLLNRRRPVGGQ